MTAFALPKSEKGMLLLILLLLKEVASSKNWDDAAFQFNVLK